ncbi:NUDIX hydrolase [Burkholderiaceae bacterium DAT-1]|nr:NUDIX hydrolase [Burkholderiaceae bacterium DAT-1]
MSDMRWKPNATVAAVIEFNGRFLLVEEMTDDGLRFNQPAGHIDFGESIADACAREAFEETGFRFMPEHLVGIYQWSPVGQGQLTYLRFAFSGQLQSCALLPGVDVINAAGMLSAGDVHLSGKMQSAPLDEGIVRAVWMTRDEAFACRERHRSPLIMQCIDDWIAGRRFSLDLIRHYPLSTLAA